MATGIIYSYDATMTNPLPLWEYYLMILSVFICQTTDAVDGKHARKTNRTSALGQLLDHGLDCFAYSFQIIFVGYSLRSAGGWEIIVIQALSYGVDFIHNWEEYYSGVFMTQRDGIGYTEFQFLICLFISIIPIFGYEAPFYKLFGLIQVRHLLCLVFILV
jgi:ethanolaminephosphotransferase